MIFIIRGWICQINKGVNPPPNATVPDTYEGSFYEFFTYPNFLLKIFGWFKSYLSFY